MLYTMSHSTYVSLHEDIVRIFLCGRPIRGSASVTDHDDPGEQPFVFHVCYPTRDWGEMYSETWLVSAKQDQLIDLDTLLIPFS